MSIAAAPVSTVPVSAEDTGTAPVKSPPPKRQVTALADPALQPEAR